MKKTQQLLVAGFILVSTFVFGQDDFIYMPPTLSDFELSNKVKTVKEECHLARVQNDGSISDLDDNWPIYYQANSMMFFDTSGRMIKDVFDSDNPSVTGTDFYQYEGDLLKKVNNRQQLLIREYDSFGKPLADKFKNKTPAQIAENTSNWQEELQFSENHYLYDDKNRIIKIEGKDADPEYNYTYTFIYDSFGILNSIRFELLNYETIEIEYFTHDSLGNLIKWELEYEGEGIEQTKIYEYSNNSLSTITTVSPNHSQVLKKIENYENNLIISKTTFFISGDTENENYEYLFDERGNWVTKIIKTKSNPKEVFVVNRTIEYY